MQAKCKETIIVPLPEMLIIFRTKSSWLLILTGLYCVVSVMMNYLCMKPMSFGTGFIWMDGGLLISWIVFMVSNVIVESYDRRTAILITGIAAVVVLFMSILAAIEVLLPTTDDYQEQAEHFANIFSNGPRTILSSVVAFFCGSWVNISIIDRLKHRCATLHASCPPSAMAFRAVLSTIVGQLVDNTLFQTLAFAPVGLSMYEMFWDDILSAIGMSTLVETVIESLFVPLITIPLSRYIASLDS